MCDVDTKVCSINADVGMHISFYNADVSTWTRLLSLFKLINTQDFFMLIQRYVQ